MESHRNTEKGEERGNNGSYKLWLLNNYHMYSSFKIMICEYVYDTCWFDLVGHIGPFIDIHTLLLLLRLLGNKILFSMLLYCTISRQKDNNVDHDPQCS